MADFTKNPAFQKMEPKKKKMIELLADSLYHKNISDALPAVMAWQKQMEQEHIKFTEEENKLLSDILFAELSPEGKRRYETIKTLIKPKET